MRKRREKVVKSKIKWNRPNKIRKIKIVMTVVAIALCVSIAAGAVLVWIQIKHPFSNFSNVSTPVNSVSTSSEALPVYENSYNLAVVNYSMKIKPDFQVQLESFDGITVDSRIIPALKEMINKSRLQGCRLKFVSGYVKAKEQDELFLSEVQKLINSDGLTKVRAENQAQKTIGRGGYNENQTGMAVEFTAEDLSENADFMETDEYKWLEKNCVNYGFILRYPKNKTASTGKIFNPHHFRYIGTDNAIKMRAYSMCLEEYAAYIKQQASN